MPEIIAYCGLSCHTCPIYLASREKNLAKRTRLRLEIVRLCKEQYGLDYELADITDCNGCLTSGDKLFSACKDCLIRNCAREKHLENCAYCPDYACETLEAFFQTEQAAKTRLEAVRSSAGGTPTARPPGKAE